MLAVNTKAPDFTLQDKDGNSVSLSDFHGKKIILYFYPKDDTPGCTIEAKEFNDKTNEYKEKQQTRDRKVVPFLKERSKKSNPCQDEDREINIKGPGALGKEHNFPPGQYISGNERGNRQAYQKNGEDLEQDICPPPGHQGLPGIL